MKDQLDIVEFFLKTASLDQLKEFYEHLKIRLPGDVCNKIGEIIALYEA